MADVKGYYILYDRGRKGPRPGCVRPERGLRNDSFTLLFFYLIYLFFLLLSWKRFSF
jgi:hypothetical protein